MATGGMAVDRRNSIETYPSSHHYHSFPSYSMAEGTHPYGHSSLTLQSGSNHQSSPPSIHVHHISPRSSRQSTAVQQGSYLPLDSHTDGPSSIHSAPQSYSRVQNQAHSLERESTSSNTPTGLIPRSAPSSLERPPVSSGPSSLTGSNTPTGLIPRSAPSSLERPPVSSGPSGLTTHQNSRGGVQGSAYYESRQRLSPQASRPVAAPRKTPNQQPAQTQPVPKPRTRRGSSDILQESSSTSRRNENLSAATLENSRYSLEHFHTSDHANEDRHFIVDRGSYQVLAVFDGHDGDLAAQLASRYMEEYFKSESWDRVVKQSGGMNIPEALKVFFEATESEFFHSIRGYIDERNRLQARIPQHLKSFEAYQRYPTEVKRLQEIEPHISGGCTAVVAVIANNNLYVANVGDSRAVLIFERPNGTLAARQLSVDHCVENEQELKRLAGLGLNVAQIVSSGRLGTQDNTRSIGDYNIKEGYKNVDVLSSAKEQPGTAEPYVMPEMELKESLRYLVLMSDGVYKSIEGMFSNQESIDANKVLLNMIDTTIQKSRTFTTVSDGVLDRIRNIHKDTYEKNARVDPRSPLATSCRKRDDMTLIVYKFSS